MMVTWKWALGRILNSRLLNPWEPKPLKMLERETGIEPATCSLGSYRSTTELLPPGSCCAFILLRSVGPGKPQAVY